MGPQFHHFALKVSNAENAVQLLCSKGGIKANETAYFAEVGMQIGFVLYNGILIELLQPVDASCPIANDRNGLHHVAFEMDDIDLFHTQVACNPVVHEVQKIRKGREGRIFFFSMKANPKIWYECMEKRKNYE